MSTRARIKMTDSFGDTLWFYRHSDGYPEVTGKSLEVFLDWVKTGKIRDNCTQAGGWLIVLGREEYLPKGHCATFPGKGKAVEHGMGWKVGAYEPLSGFKSSGTWDIAYEYHINLEKKTLTWKEANA